MVLDTRTMVLIVAIQFLAIGVYVLVAAGKDYPADIQKSMRLWGVACLIQAADWLLGGLRSLLPDFFTIVIVNTLIMAAQVGTYRALRVFDGYPDSRKFSAFAAVLVLAIFLGSLLLRANLVAHAIILTIVTVLPPLVCGLHLVFSRRGKLGKSRTVLASGFGLLTVIYAVRTFAFILSNSPSTTPIEANTLLQSLVMGATILSVLTISVGFLGMCMESFNDRLLRLSATDELTNLYNRREIKRLTEEAMQRAKRAGQPLAFLLLDANDFKTVNDRYGHLAGDAALQAIANAIRANLRSSDIVGRLGGDEFVVALPNATLELAQQVAERLVSAVNAIPVYFEGDRINLSISCGATILSNGERNFADLVQKADRILYEMKPDRKDDVLSFKEYSEI